MRYLNTYEDFQINEEVSEQPLYHYTTLSNLYLILKSDKLISRYVGDISSDQWKKISKKSISFTRKKLSLDQLSGIQDGVSEPIRIIIHFDYEKLNQKYKFVPWSDSRSKSPDINNSQFEERCTSDILNVKKYIKRIEVIYNQVIGGMSYSGSLKNDTINFHSGKDKSSSNLPYDEFIKSEFFKKSLYDILSLDKSLRREFSQMYNTIISTKSQKATFKIIDSKLLICLWIWWLFNKTRELASGITFDFNDRNNLNEKNVLNVVKLNISKNDLIKSMSSIKDILLKDFKKNYDGYLSDEKERELYKKEKQKSTELNKKQEQDKENQKRRDSENKKIWRKKEEERLEREREIIQKKSLKERKKFEFKFKDEISNDENYLSIVKWSESNNLRISTYKSDPIEFLKILRHSIGEIYDDMNSSVYDNLNRIESLFNNAKGINNFKKTIEECKELLLSIKKILDTHKPSTFKRIKRFFNQN